MADEDEEMTPEQTASFQRDNCIFCKIISGEIPSKKIHEDEEFIGILDINPASEGHVLLIPKQHYQILPQLPPELVGNLGLACAKISGKIIKSFKCDGTSVFIANGAVAGQRAPHFMMHIMPRKEGDGISLNPKLADIDDRLFQTIRERLISSTTAKRPSPQMDKTRIENEEKTEENIEDYSESIEKSSVETAQSEREKEVHDIESKPLKEQISNNKAPDTEQNNIEENEDNFSEKQNINNDKNMNNNIDKSMNIDDKESELADMLNDERKIKAAKTNKKENNRPPVKKGGKIDFDKLSRLFGK